LRPHGTQALGVGDAERVAGGADAHFRRPQYAARPRPRSRS
jgi:hypothetical protein